MTRECGSVLGATRSCVTVNTAQIQENCQIYRKLLQPGQQIMAVVKADAYGHGDAETADALSKIGIRDFAVSNILEAVRLREHGIEGQILILGYTDPRDARALAEYDITQALLSEEYALALKAACPRRIKCHAALDTGMRRIGLNADDPERCERVIRAAARDFDLTGLFTHLCAADSDREDDREFTEKQIAAFRRVAERVKDLHLEYVHCLNSAGGLWHNAGGGMVRLGIVLYGLKPDASNLLPCGIEPALEWKSVVSQVKEVLPGDSIGYGRTYRVTRPMTVATIPTGYADGYRRELSNKGYVLINGSRAPVVGRVCMDQFMTDVTGIPDVHMGTEAVLIGRSGSETVTADDLAGLCGTIGYEIVCGISKRVLRIYQ